MRPLEPASDRYLREHLLGEGGMGRVWAARDRHLDRRVALKEPRGRSGGPAAQRLRREAMVLSRLDHPGIVPLLDQGHLPDGRPFLVMRLVGGDDLGHQPPVSTLSDRLDRARCLRDVVAAIAHAHSRGVVHRDLKPANVRVDGDGAVQILDWGLARVVGEESATHPQEDSLPRTRVGARLGTPAYMSPEQAAGEVVGPRSDVWSLGLLLWEGLSGQRAYTGRAASEVLAGVLSGPPPSLKRVVPELPAALCAVVDGALSAREDRPADAGVLLKELDAALREVAAGATQRRRSRWVGALVGLLGGGVVLGLVALTRPSVPELPSVAQMMLFLQQGDVRRAELAAAERLGQLPDDPHARGVLVHGGALPSLVWEAPPPVCSIGEVVRWDGRAVACASEGNTSFYELGPDGIVLRWTKSYENHMLVFMGAGRVVGKAPRTDSLVVLSADDGAPRHGFPFGFGDAGITGSRHDSLLVGRVDESTPGAGLLRERASLSSSEPVRRTFSRAPGRLLVLSDGSELYLEGMHLRRRAPDADGDDLIRSWTVPEAHGRPVRYAVSPGERTVAVATELGHVAVASLTEEGWSPWADRGLHSSAHLTVSDDGRHVAATVRGRNRVWSSAQPSSWIQLPGVGGLVRFASDTELMSYGRDKVRWWHLSEPLGRSSRDAGGPVDELVWGEGGIIARHGRQARVWDSNGRVVADVEAVVAVGRESQGPRRYVVDTEDRISLYEDGRAVVGRDGQPVRVSTSGCRFTDWPAGGPIVCADEDGGPYLLDPDTGQEDKRLALASHRWAAVRATGARVALMDWDTRMYTWEDGSLKAHFSVPWANRVVLTGPGDALLVNGRRGLLRRPLDGGEETRVSSDWERATRVVLSPSGKWVAVRSFFGGAQVWKVDTGELALVLPDTLGPVTSLAWAPDGQRLAVGTAAGTVHLLDLTPLTLPADALRARVESTWLSVDRLATPQSND